MKRPGRETSDRRACVYLSASRRLSLFRLGLRRCRLARSVVLSWWSGTLGRSSICEFILCPKNMGSWVWRQCQKFGDVASIASPSSLRARLMAPDRVSHACSFVTPDIRPVFPFGLLFLGPVGVSRTDDVPSLSASFVQSKSASGAGPISLIRLCSQSVPQVCPEDDSASFGSPVLVL